MKINGRIKDGDRWLNTFHLRYNLLVAVNKTVLELTYSAAFSLFFTFYLCIFGRQRRGLLLKPSFTLGTSELFFLSCLAKSKYN